VEIVQIVATVVPNLIFAAIYVTATGRWIDRGLTSLENRVAFLEAALMECLDMESAKRDVSKDATP